MCDVKLAKSKFQLLFMMKFSPFKRATAAIIIFPLMTSCLVSIACASLSASPPKNLKLPKPPAYALVRAELFTHFEAKTGHSFSLPNYPDGNLLTWVDGRFGTVAKEEAARYQLLGEHLLLSAQLMESSDLLTRKRGY